MLGDTIFLISSRAEEMSTTRTIVCTGTSAIWMQCFMLLIVSLRRFLALWLWPPLMQQELDDLRDRLNSRRMRKDKNKLTPSGCSPNEAYDLYEDYNGVHCLQPVDTAVVQQIMDDIERERNPVIDWGVPEEFAAHAQEVYDSLDISNLTMKNVWIVFKHMLDHW